ncbi:epoxide hydrolase 4-like [Physella acuta]|uniref:epoxide hydrolase 4-like n=1 Tax=Physella acuta TaxID=109671 RepID=UPI0027DEA4D6|nr:epoxide hydrolase 4-like [Physella acuta]
MPKFFMWLMLWFMAVWYGLKVLFNILKECCLVGCRKVFHWKVISRPACLDDPTLGTHGFLDLKDVTIHYVASGPEGGPLMLFVHGFPEFWFSWRHQIREFQKDYRVVAIDQRGYGESSKPKGKKAYVMNALVSDLKQVIEALGYQSCTLVAHDWGGVVVWPFARLHPQMVDKLIVLNAPPGPVFQNVLKKNKKQLKMSWYMFFFQLPYLPEVWARVCDLEVIDCMFGGKHSRISGFPVIYKTPTPFTEEEIAAYKYTYCQPGSITAPINYYRASLQLPQEKINYDLDYDMPVLLIWGCQDLALCKEIPEETKKMNPKITVRYIEEGGHFVQMDTPELVNSAIREWLHRQK